MKKNFRKLAVDELAHRLKNKIATIQSIVNFRLREDPEIRNDINSALSSLMAVDDLITSTQGKGADIGEILSAELGPYDVSRVAMDGPRCLLAPKLALIMALLIHELRRTPRNMVPYRRLKANYQSNGRCRTTDCNSPGLKAAVLM